MAVVGEVQRLASLTRKRRVVTSPAADVRASSAVALGSGGRVVPHPTIPDAPQVITWELAGDCMEPVLVVREGKGHFQMTRDFRDAEWQPGRTLAQAVRCRNCVACMRWRRRQWGRAGQAEWVAATMRGWRSWFLTLTIRPELRFRLKAETVQRVGQDAFDRMDETARFRELSRTFQPLVTNYLKRLRKAGHKFRYMLVTERHKDGWPHFHLLLHEASDSRVTYKALHGSWSHGITEAKLAKDDRCGFYLAKYLSKDKVNRIRASQGYGAPLVCEAVSEDLRF